MSVAFLPKPRPGMESDIAAGDVPVMVLALDRADDEDWWLVMTSDGKTSWALRGAVRLLKTAGDDDWFSEADSE